MNQQDTLPGFAQRHETWNEVTAVSTIGRRTMCAVPNYRLLKAATQIDATASARLLLVHLIGYLGPDDPAKPTSRFIVFPGNTRLSDELRCTPRSIQRQADELEEKGMLRRCYNGMNRRTGFDLTPFAMQHEAVTADIVAVQTKRKQERELAQLELGLEADRITRPTTSASSKGDTDVALNRTDLRDNDGRAVAASALDAIDPVAFATLSEHASVSEDRTLDPHAAILVSVNDRFTRGGRTSHLGWAAAIQTLGPARALALYLVAEADPRRRATPERYFGWLLRAAASGDGAIVAEAANRAAASVSSRLTTPQPAIASTIASSFKSIAAGLGIPTPEPKNPTTPAKTVGACDLRLDDAIRRELGPRIFESWLGGATITQADGSVTVVANNAFAANWIETHLLGAIETAAASVAGKPMDVHVKAAA